MRLALLTPDWTPNGGISTHVRLVSAALAVAGHQRETELPVDVERDALQEGRGLDPEMGRENYRAKQEQFSPRWLFLDYRLLLLQEHPVVRAAYLLLSKKGIYLPPKRGVKTVAVGRWLPIFRPHFSLRNLLRPARLPTDLPDGTYTYFCRIHPLMRGAFRVEG